MAQVEVKEWLVIHTNLLRCPNEPDFEILECSDEDLLFELTKLSRYSLTSTAVPLTIIKDQLTQMIIRCPFPAGRIN